LHRIGRGEGHYLLGGVDLLGHQGPCGGHEHDLPLGIPPVEVVHHHCRNEGLSQARGKHHQGVLEQRRLDDTLLVGSQGKVGRVDPVVPGGRVESLAGCIGSIVSLWIENTGL